MLYSPTMEMMRQKLFVAFALVLAVFCTGVAGYRLIEGWSLLDAVYMTVITLGSVGYGETNPLHPAGRVFTIVLIGMGMSVYVYALTTITAFFVEGELGGVLRRKRMQKKLAKLAGHYLVCGSGAVARHIAAELAQTGRPFVFIDSDAASLQLAQAEFADAPWLQGNPADDETLQTAGIDRAAGVVVALDTDKDNVFVVITARSLHPQVRIVTAAHGTHAHAKLRRAGADAVVSTEAIGGLRMASELVRPTVVSFLDQMLRSSDAPVRFEEIAVSDCRALAGKKLREADINRRTGLIVIAIRDALAGCFIHNPPADHCLREQDVMIVLGDSRQLAALREL